MCLFLDTYHKQHNFGEDIKCFLVMAIVWLEWQDLYLVVLYLSWGICWLFVLVRSRWTDFVISVSVSEIWAFSLEVIFWRKCMKHKLINIYFPANQKPVGFIKNVSCESIKTLHSPTLFASFHWVAILLCLLSAWGIRPGKVVEKREKPRLGKVNAKPRFSQASKSKVFWINH